VKRNDNIATHGEPRINFCGFSRNRYILHQPQGTLNTLGTIVNFVRNTQTTMKVWQQRQHTFVRFENKRIEEDPMSQAKGAQTA